MKQDIKWLAKEYELATSEEIATALTIRLCDVTRVLQWSRDCRYRDLQEYKRRGITSLDLDMISIMRKRLAERRRLKEAA